ncbi:MAG: folate-binding protein [Pseudomonadota bacterium]
MERQVLEISGEDAERFLSDLITNHLPPEGELGYAALLSPQGKYLFDFFVLRRDGGFWIDVAKERAQALGQRLMMYRLRAKVEIKTGTAIVATGLTNKPATAFDDPRSPALGWRDYDGAPAEDVDWDAVHVENLIPATGIELIADDSYILEMGFERLNGVDFKKGCYVGQEVTARMKHKTELRKGLAHVTVSSAVPVGTEITSNGKSVGTLYTQAGGKGLAYLRFDRAKGPMQAGDAEVALVDAD